MEPKHVYVAINEVTAIMAREGIAKSRRNVDQKYNFRGIDDVYAALSTHLANAKLCMLPRVVDRTATERVSKSGSVLTFTTLLIDFDFVSAVDGSMHTIRTAGEAMDTSDKSTNKAQSAAMKYACIMAFQIPTEGDNDADASHHEPRSLEKPLADSIELMEWSKLASARLLTAENMGELVEAWAQTSEEAKKRGATNGVLKSLAATKDAQKVKLTTSKSAT